jgi:hypothetical protein
MRKGATARKESTSPMVNEDPVFTDPESYGIENPDAPGEPNRDALPPVDPVPGTGRGARIEHQRRHDEEGTTPSDDDFRGRKEREEIEEFRRELEETGEEGP